MKLSIDIEKWPVRGVFRIARRETTDTNVLVVTLQQGDHFGRGEAGPIIHYGEDVHSCTAQLEAIRGDIERGVTPQNLAALLPPGSARNALDCALWDLAAKQAGQRAWQLLDLSAPDPLTTAFTISVDTPNKVLEAAEAAARMPLLKLKLAGDDDDLIRVRVVRAAAPLARLVVDANEAFDIGTLGDLVGPLAGLQVEMIEQPLPADDDDALAGFDSPVPLCADESCHVDEDLDVLATKYQAINIKLDKTGGLTAALELANRATAAGLDLMVGCMLGTSLAMAPALLVAQQARWVDLDGPLLLERDREPGLHYDNGIVSPSTREVWG
jgi:L-alanine-DL-glutamate epimerase-like enolase superfamily enzyme